MKKKWIKRIGASLIAMFIICMSALLGTSFCLCIEDFDNCGTAHCDCFGDVADSDAPHTDSGEDECSDITINALDAVLGAHGLKLIAIPQPFSPPSVVCEIVFKPMLLQGFLPPTTAPPWPSSHYLITSSRLYPRT